MPFTDGNSWWLYRGASLYAVGTSLCYRKDWWEQHRFPGLQNGEDNAFVAAAASARQIITTEAGDLMHATIHPSNTSPRNLTGSNWTAISR